MVPVRLQIADPPDPPLIAALDRVLPPQADLFRCQRFAPWMPHHSQFSYNTAQ